MYIEDYWDSFKQTGNVMDYLCYKGVELCNQAFDEIDSTKAEQKQAGEIVIESDNKSNGHGFISSAYGRV